MKSVELEPHKLAWQGVRLTDPMGPVFELDGEFYRAIRTESAAFVDSLFEKGIPQSLSEQGLLLPVSFTKLKVRGFAQVLHTKKIPFPSKAYQWPPSLYRDAARCLVSLNMELFKHRLRTIDYHTSNIQQWHNSNPVWIDFGSIQPVENKAAPRNQSRSDETIYYRIRNMVREISRRTILRSTLIQHILSHFPNIYRPVDDLPPQFRHEFIFPLYLISQSSDWFGPVRALLRGGGITDKTFYMLSRKKSVFRPMPKSLSSRYHIVQQWLDSIDMPMSTTRWANYIETSPLQRSTEPSDPRTQAVIHILDKIKPDRVVDLGCNTGHWTFLAAKRGAEVLALDYDEGAIERLYKDVRDYGKGMKITVGIRNLVTEMPLPRERAPFVMAMALSHHLSISQKYPFAYIAKNFASYTTDTLITDFMPNGLGGTSPTPNPLPDGYTLDRFVDAFKPYFSSVEVLNTVVPEGYSERILVYCRGRTEVHNVEHTPFDCLKFNHST